MASAHWVGRAGRRGDVAVEHHDVPAAHVIAVVELPRVARGGAEIPYVGRRPRAETFHVADGGPGAGLVATPRGVIAVDEVRRAGAPALNVVADGEDGAGDAVEQGRGGLVVLPVAAGNVPGSHEHLRPDWRSDRDGLRSRV